MCNKKGLNLTFPLQKSVNNLDVVKQEGIVIRPASSFHYTNFSKSVAKWVRKNHVQTDNHWIHSEIIPNKLK